MPKYKVLVGGVFGEGYQEGEIIEMDTDAARIRVLEGHLELLPDEPAKVRKPRAKKE